MKRIFLSLGVVFGFFQMTQAQSTLSAGDVAIVSVASDNPDEFGLLLLSNVLSGTELHFTDMGWIASTNTFRRGEDSMTWKANTNLPAGTLVIFNSDVAGTTTCTFGQITQGKIDGLAAAGDQILVFQGGTITPAFLFAVNFSGSGWASDATTSNTSAVPAGLTDGVNAVHVTGMDNMLYQSDSIGTSAMLLGKITDPANWTANDARPDFDPSDNGRLGFFTMNGTPYVRNYAGSFNGDFGQIQVNASSSPSSFSVAGNNLSSNIVVTVAAPFQVRVGSSGSFSGSVNIAPVFGIVNPTTVEVQFSPTAAGTFSDTVQITSTNAFTNQLLVSGEALGNPVVEFIATSKTMMEAGAPDSIGVRILNKGTSTVIANLMAKPNQTAMEGFHFTFPNGPQVTFDASSADTLYFKIDPINDLNSGPMNRQNKFGLFLQGGDKGTRDSLSLTIQENDYKYAKIAEVKQLRANGTTISSDSLFAVTGVVYGGNTRTSGYSFTIIDETGGISNFAPASASTFGYTATEGDSILMRGRLTQFNGLAQLDFLDTIRVLKTGATLKQPMVQPTLDESSENDLVRIDNVKFITPVAVWSVTGSGTNYRVYTTTNHDTFEIRILPTSGLANATAPEFAEFSIIGIGGQFDNSAPHFQGYQLMPRYTSDVIADEMGPFDLVSPLDNSTIELEGDSTQVLTFVWTRSQSMLSIPALHQYTFHFDESTGDFSSPVLSKSAGTDSSAEFTYMELADALSSILSPGNSITLLWTVEASNGAQTEWAASRFLITFERGFMEGLYTAQTMARIYPNPSTGTLNVEMAEAAERIQLFDINGKLVKNLDKPAAFEQLSLDGLSNGVYMLSITKDGKVYQSKVVVAAN